MFLSESRFPSTLPTATTMSQLAESDMYDWRVRALMNWIEKNKNSDNSLSMDKLASAGHLDQYHYLGLAANDQVIQILGLRPGMTVLDVGCGIGGPARYMSWKSGASVTGVDIQEGLVNAGNRVSDLVGLSNTVRLVAGDMASETPLFEKEQFDVFVSLLVILHIENRKALFSSLFNSLKAGGGFVIEDMVFIGSSPFNEDENRIAKDVIGSPYLPSIEEYNRHLAEAGFVDVEFEFLTEEWTKWCIDRSDQYNSSRDDQIRMHGEKVFAQRSSFYADVKKLFLSGKLGGVRITGRKANHVETSIRNHRASNRPTKESLKLNTRIIE